MPTDEDEMAYMRFHEQAMINQEKELIEKGYVPKRMSTPMGSSVEWKKGGAFEWPMAAAMIGLMAFVVCIVWGSPW